MAIRGTKNSGTAGSFRSLGSKISKVTDTYLTANLNWWGNGSDGSLDVGANAQNYVVPASVDDWVKVLNLTSFRIRAGYSMTTSNRCRGLAIYVDGDALIEGTLTMTARGAYTPNINSEVGANGLRFVRRKSGQAQVLSASDVAGTGSALIAAESAQPGINSNGKIYTIPRIGGAGGSRYHAGNALAMAPGGGGGGGGGWEGGYCPSGVGSAATCFCGGAGGGASNDASKAGGDGGAYGGAGGSGSIPASNCGAGGGAGNPGGAAPNTLGYPGSTGIGGVILLFVRGTLTVTGVVSANGTNGGGWHDGQQQGAVGGSSGGGLIMALYGTGFANSGTFQANGGISVPTNNTFNGYFVSAAGGAGYVLAEQVDV